MCIKPCLVGVIFTAASRLIAQSGQLTALEGAVPVPVVEPTAATFSAGLAGLWSDPTTTCLGTGAFFSVQQATFSRVRVFQAVLAFKWGPRWSFIYGSTELGDLFDSSLTSQDPTLAGLKARAIWSGADATMGSRYVSGSLGFAFAGDENVGDVHSSTIARAHLRASPMNSGWLQIGLGVSRVVGGSLPTERLGQQHVDVVVARRFGTTLSTTLSVAASRGALWRFSETRGAYGVGAQVSVLSVVDFSAGFGRYTTAYGATSHGWHSSASVGITLHRVHATF